MSSDLSPSKQLLADPGMRRAIEDFVRRRVPASDVDDVVQTVLVEALASAARPQDEVELRKWLIGIARHKVVDHHRRASRETASDLPDVPIGPAPIEAKNLAQWAAKQAGASGDAQSTLEWMAREGEGEKLETIAAEEKVPAARVRQRVSRMRRWMKERWLAELAAAALVVVLGFVLWRVFRKEEPITQPTPEPKPSSNEPNLDRARALREKAFKACDNQLWQECIAGLDEAKGIDPAGEGDPRVGAARQKAAEALNQQTPTPTSAPSTVNSAKPTSEPDQKKEVPRKTIPSTPSSVSPKTKPPAKPTKGTFDDVFRKGKK